MRKFSLYFIGALSAVACSSGAGDHAPSDTPTEQEGAEKQENEVVIPYKVDHSTSPYFRPIHDQGRDGSCAQGSGIGYTMTYMLNSLRDISSQDTSNQFPIYFTWNYLNEGDGFGTFSVDGWDIAKSNGIPYSSLTGNSVTFDWNSKKWLSGYNVYYQGMRNRIGSYASTAVDTPEELQLIKRFFLDRGNGSKVGGIVNFSAGNDKVRDTLVEGTEEAGKQIITEWRHQSEHAMTYIGYNDSVKFDINGDGKYTNDIDITGDGIVNLKDWEIGALRVANTYGTDWADEGYSYMMYRLLALDQRTEGGISSHGRLFVTNPLKEYSPQITIKTSLKHSSRFRLNIKVGIAQDPEATEPEHTISFRQFRNVGGNLPLNGENDEAIEIGLDATPLLNKIEAGKAAKFFLSIDSDGGKGEIVQASIIDYTQDINGVETAIEASNVAITPNAVTNIGTSVTTNATAAHITTESLEKAQVNTEYKGQLEGSEENLEYSIDLSYTLGNVEATFPETFKDTLFACSDDDGYVTQKIGFDFPIYGRSYNELHISTNGYILFDDHTESQITPNKKITAFGADIAIRPKQGEFIGFEETADYVLIRWLASYSYEKDQKVDVAVKLYKDGSVEYFFRNLSPDLYYVAGLSDGLENNVEHGISATNKAPEAYSFSLKPAAFPIGLQIARDGKIGGTPTSAGSYTVRVNAKNKNGITTTKALSLEVAESL